MARETFNVCDRCARREKLGGAMNETIETVSVLFGSDKVTKDFCRDCRQALRRWVNEPLPREAAK